MKYGRYRWSYLFLSLGLGLTFLWIGVDIFRNPEVWIGYVPANPGFGFTRDTALQLGGAFDMALGLMMLFKVWSKLAGSLAAFHMLGILVVHGLDAVLIRDVGLLGASLALATWPTRYHKRRLSKLRLPGFKSSGTSE